MGVHEEPETPVELAPPDARVRMGARSENARDRVEKGALDPERAVGDRAGLASGSGQAEGKPSGAGPGAGLAQGVNRPRRLDLGEGAPLGPRRQSVLFSTLAADDSIRVYIGGGRLN
jgi:hypothetical protein